MRIAREAGVQRLEAQVLAENSPCLAQSGHLIVGGRDGSGGGTLALESITIKGRLTIPLFVKALS